MNKLLKGGIAVLTLTSCTATALAGAAAGNLYAVDSSRALFEVNMQTGEKTPIGTVSANAGTSAGLAYRDENGTVYLTSTNNDSLYTLDLTTGAATLVGPYGDAALVMHGLEYNSQNNTMYGMSSHNAGLYTISMETGAATFVGVSGIVGGSNFHNLVFASDTNTMYGVASVTDSFYSVNLNTGAFSLIGVIGGATNPNSMAFNSISNIIYVADNNTDILYRINRNTGAGTEVGPMGPGNILGLVYIPPTVTVSGNLTLLDTVAGPGYSRSILVEVELGQSKYFTHAAISGIGTYTVKVPVSLQGTARIRADGSSFLKTTSTVFLTGSNVTKHLTLRNGDVDNSGEVDAADIDAVIAMFGSTGQPVEDVDMSGEVDAADIDIVIANFGETDN